MLKYTLKNYPKYLDLLKWKTNCHRSGFFFFLKKKDRPPIKTNSKINVDKLQNNLTFTKLFYACIVLNWSIFVNLTTKGHNLFDGSLQTWYKI